MDLISRQAAIDLWEKYHPTIAVDAMQYDAELRQLPSAQPERKNEPAGCNGCRYDWFGDPRCAKCSRSFQDHYEAERKKE